MSSCIERSKAVWIPGDVKSRERLDDIVYSVIGDKKENLNGFPSGISKLDILKIVDYLEEYPSFGESEWTTLCGRVDLAPPLPPDFSDIWNGPCPIYPGKKICETHMLVYIPARVDGNPFTLKKLGEIAKRFFPRNNASMGHVWCGHTGFEYIYSGIVDELGDKSIESRWVLMTKDVLPGSRKKSYAEQQEIVAGLVKKTLGYRVPNTLEAATCILAQYFSDSKTRLFSEEEPRTYTRCEEKFRCCQVIVGGFKPTGLSVSKCDRRDRDIIGIAALREFR